MKCDKKIVERIRENTPMITFITSGVSTIAVMLFKGATYIYYRGYFDFWNIPNEYIYVNYSDMLFKFIMIVALSFIFMGLSTVYVYFFNSKSKSKARKRLKQIALILLAAIVVTAIFIGAFLLEGFQINEIMEYFRYNKMWFVESLFFIMLLVFTMVFVVGNLVYATLFLEDDEIKDNKKKNKKNKKRNNKKNGTTKQDKHYVKNGGRIVGIGLLIVVIYGLFQIGMTIYNTGKNSCSREKMLDVVTLENKTYVVTAKCQDNWILKECYENNGMQIINYDQYLIGNIEGKNIKNCIRKR